MGTFFSITRSGYKHVFTYIFLLAFQKAGTNVVLPPKTLFREKKEKEAIVGLSMAKYWKICPLI